MTANNFPSDKLQTINSGAENFDYGAFATEWAIWGVFGRAGYNYDQKYFLDLSLRRDGSSRFGANKRFATFYSVGAGWSISEESFFDVSFVDALKIRGSYGTSGNQAIDNFASRGLYQFGAYNAQSAAFPVQLDNPDLTWELSNQLECWLRFSVIQRSIGRYGRLLLQRDIRYAIRCANIKNNWVL